MFYKELAFKATIVPEYTVDYLVGKSGSGCFIETDKGIKKFENEDKAISYILSTLKLNKYVFIDVFYNPSYARQEEDSYKYDKYIMLIIRETHAVNNEFIRYLTADINASGNLFDDDFEDHTLNEPLALENTQGLGLEPIIQDIRIVKDKERYDVRDNFIYKILDKQFTCDSLYHYIIDQSNKARSGGDIAFVDVTGSELKSTFRDNLIIDSSLDIYREFFGGTTKTDEEIHQDEIDKDNAINANMPNDSEYI